MRRTSFLAGLCLLPVLRIHSQAVTPFAGDIDFLLQEFESQAGPLLKMKNVDWAEVRKEFTTAAASIQTDQALYQLILRLLNRLQDGHAGILQSKVKVADESNGRRFTGPRVHLLVSGGQVLVRLAFKDAAAAGLTSGQEVVKIDGKKALDWLVDRVKIMGARGASFSTSQQALYAACHWGLGDWEGTPIVFTIKDQDGSLKEIRRVRNGGPNTAPFGPIHPPENLKFVGRQSYGKTKEGIGYMHLRDVPGDLPAQLDRMLQDLGTVPGLILDARANGGGGCDHEAVFGRFLGKEQSLKGHKGASDHAFTGPMVVIVDAGVRSAGETIAGMFKEDGRAYMIGDRPTAGTSSQKAEITTPSGLFKIRFSVRSNMGRFNGGRGIEGIGITPHEIVKVKAADLFLKQDTLIVHAVELLQKGFPPGVVEYAG